jgi:SdrD B-like domain
VFVFQASISGNVLLGSRNTRSTVLQGLAGITVQLWDGGGNMIATAVTDSHGHYSFNQQSGLPGTGNYSVTVVLPSGYSQISADPSPILISRGDINATGVNYVIAAPQVATHFLVLAPAFAVVGMPTVVIVEALDSSNQVVTGYTGTVHFTSSDGAASLPGDFTFSASDNGKHQFAITFATAGNDTVTATDTATGAISGSGVVSVLTRLPRH